MGRYDTAEGKIYNFYWEANKSVQNRIDAFRKLTNLFCDQLGIEIIPRIEMCDVARQNDCIRKKGGVPCGGGCYNSSPEPVIWIREMWGGFDTLLHELFHHINSCNDNKAIRQIMESWQRDQFRKTRGYGKLLRKHGIPMKKVGW